MFRTALLSCAIFAAAVTAAAAEDDVMTGLFGNTVIASGGMADTHWNYAPDHTFKMSVPAFGRDFAGKWEIKGSDLCRTFDTPPPNVKNPLCTPVAAHKVGDTWTAGDRTVKLVKGIQ